MLTRWASSVPNLAKYGETVPFAVCTTYSLLVLNTTVCNVQTYYSTGSAVLQYG